MNDLKTVNVICVGRWNTKIFIPAWVKEHLFDSDPQNKVEGLINTQEMEFGYKYKDLIITPKNELVELKLEKNEESSIKFLGQILNRLLVALPHTPIQAIGINFIFKLKKDSDNNIVKKLNKKELAIDGFEASQFVFSTKYKDIKLNLVVDAQYNMYYNLNFNFHYDKHNVLSISSEDVFKNYKHALKLLKNG